MLDALLIAACNVLTAQAPINASTQKAARVARRPMVRNRFHRFLGRRSAAGSDVIREERNGFHRHLGCRRAFILNQTFSFVFVSGETRRRLHFGDDCETVELNSSYAE